MALQKDLTKTAPNFMGELVAKNVYWRVEKVESTKDESKAIVIAYAKNGEQLNGEIDYKLITFATKLDGPNPIKQAYEHLKSLPEFADATDC